MTRDFDPLKRKQISMTDKNKRYTYSAIGKREIPYGQLLQWLWNTWKGYRAQAFLNTIVGIVMVLTDLLFVYATKLSIDIATGSENRFSLSQTIGLLISVILLQLLLRIASRWIRATLGVKAQNRMQRFLFAKLLNSQWKPLRKFHSGDLLNRMERDVTDVVGFLTESIPSFISTCLQFLGAFLFLFIMDRTLACIVVLVIPFFILSSKLYVRKMRRLTHDVRESESRIQSIIQESLQHVLIIKTLERTDTLVEKLGDRQKQLRKEVITKTKYATVSSGLMNFGFAAGYLFTFIWGVTSLQQGVISYGALIAFIQLVGQIQGPVRTLTKFIPVFIGAFTATERLIQLSDIPAEDLKNMHRISAKAGLHLCNLSFSYSGKSRCLFDHFDYEFPAGSVTAILGETGSGKTTLIRLLLALEKPTSGTVLIGENGKQSYPVSPATRCNFSYVPQGNTLLSGTIRQNLLLSAPNATDEQLRDALHDAAATFVFELPDGLDTVCGEMGYGLSEGQAQRIAIARALLRPAPILLLDEATSSLDTQTEKCVIRNIIKRYSGRTILFITHRPEVLKYATQKLVLRR